MKENNFRIVLIISTILLSLWFLYPTYQASQFQDSLESFSLPEDSADYAKENKKDIDEALDKRIKLGLDLKGGMYVVMEVDVMELLEKSAKNKDDVFYKTLEEVHQGIKDGDNDDLSAVDILYQTFQKNGVRLSRYYYDLRDTDDEILEKLKGESRSAVDRAREIIRNRVDQYGVAEPNIATKGDSRIVVELPGVSDKRRIRKLLKGTAKLEFKIVRDEETALESLQDINRFLFQRRALDSVPSSDLAEIQKVQKRLDSLDAIPDSLKTEDQRRDENPLFSKFASFENGVAFISQDDKDDVIKIFKRSDVENRLPPDLQFLFSAKGYEGQDDVMYYRLFAVKKRAELDGNVLTEAKVTFSAGAAKPEVSMRMNDEGARTWSRVTGANIGKRVAIVLDDAVFQAPVVEAKIPNGSSVIRNMENIEEAQDLEIVLKAGALPAPVRVVEERTVGPTLGADSVQAGLNAMIFSLLTVFVFMIIYYRFSGIIANVAVIFNIFFVLAFLAGFGATLTLPGIAGLVLTVGMAVDANVLIFERVREELDKGRILKVSVESGYKQAFSAIFDSHVTTFVGGALLYSFGVGPVQGFAVTLMVGIAVSLFTAVVMTKVVFDWMIINKRVTKTTFG